MHHEGKLFSISDQLLASLRPTWLGSLNQRDSLWIQLTFASNRTPGGYTSATTSLSEDILCLQRWAAAFRWWGLITGSPGTSFRRLLIRREFARSTSQDSRWRSSQAVAGLASSHKTTPETQSRWTTPKARIRSNLLQPGHARAISIHH